MTAIVGVAGAKGFLAGDRRVTQCGSRSTVPTKVFAGPYLCAGVCGMLADVFQVKKAIRTAEALEDIQAVLSEDSEALVLKGGKLYCVDSTMVLPMPGPIAAIGSGGDEARAFLAGRRDHTEAGVRAALGYVAGVRCDCGDSVTFARPKKSATPKRR